MIKSKIKRIHFIGINGSGLSGVACIAKEKGFDVDGCDIVLDTFYTQQLKKKNINIIQGHSIEHLKNVDLVVVSPALLYQDKYKTIEETRIAFNEGKLIRWQQFLGEYIFNKQNIVAVTGTHGKTTTSTLMALFLEKANFDPTVMIGGIVKEWNKTYRCGKSDFYVCEADEYDGNFLYYYPKYVILNNIEMDHPEIFDSYDKYLDNFKQFLLTVQKNGKIFFNIDEKNVLSLLLSMYEYFEKQNIDLIAVSINNERKNFNNIKVVNVKANKNDIFINGVLYKHRLLGEHNVKNIALAISLSLELDVDINSIKDVLNTFLGTKRRMDLIFSSDRIKLYDDYGHHYTQIFCTLKALKENIEKDTKIIAVLEPHLISRIKNNTNEFVNAMLIADYSIIFKIYKSREYFLDDSEMTKILSSYDKIQYIENLEDVIDKVINIIDRNVNSKFVVVVMGAGNSYKISYKLKEIFKNRKN